MTGHFMLALCLCIFHFEYRIHGTSIHGIWQCHIVTVNSGYTMYTHYLSLCCISFATFVIVDPQRDLFYRATFKEVDAKPLASTKLASRRPGADFGACLRSCNPLSGCLATVHDRTTHECSYYTSADATEALDASETSAVVAKFTGKFSRILRT